MEKGKENLTIFNFSDSVLGKINRKCPGIGCLVGKNTDGECCTFPDVDWCRAHNAIVYGFKKKKK